MLEVKKNYRRTYVKQQREKVNDFKNSLSCLKCGEDKNHLLDFHHIDPKEKKFKISQGFRYSWKRIKQEIDKCIILCSNCHRDFHHQEKEKGIKIEEYLNQNQIQLCQED